MTVLGGSLFQILVPVICAVAFARQATAVSGFPPRSAHGGPGRTSSTSRPTSPTRGSSSSRSSAGAPAPKSKATTGSTCSRNWLAASRPPSAARRKRGHARDARRAGLGAGDLVAQARGFWYASCAFRRKTLARHYRSRPDRFQAAGLRSGGYPRQGLKRTAIETEAAARMADLQEHLYAQDRWAVLLIFQALDAAGKDSTIKHVMSGSIPRAARCTLSRRRRRRNSITTSCGARPACCRAAATSASSIARTTKRCSSSACIPNSWRAADPRERVTRRSGTSAIEDINNFERYLWRQGIVIRKFYLHVSKEEQQKRFLKRLEEPEKNWKFSMPT